MHPHAGNLSFISSPISCTSGFEADWPVARRDKQDQKRPRGRGMDFVEANGAGLRCRTERQLASARWCWSTKWAARSKAGTTSRQGSRHRAACCAMTPAAPECRRRCAATSRSIRWPTTSQPCSIISASPARSRWQASPSAAHRPALRGATQAAHQRRRGRQPGHRHRSRAPRPGAGAARADRGRRHGVRGRGFDAERLCAGASRRHQAVRALPRRDGSATIPQAMQRSGACWRQPTCRTNSPGLLVRSS